MKVMELLLSRELSCLTTRAKMTLRLFSNTLFLVAVELLPRLCPPEGTRKEGREGGREGGRVTG